jgi:hypothetical protein
MKPHTYIEAREICKGLAMKSNLTFPELANLSAVGLSTFADIPGNSRRADPHLEILDGVVHFIGVGCACDPKTIKEYLTCFPYSTHQPNFVSWGVL